MIDEQTQLRYLGYLARCIAEHVASGFADKQSIESMRDRVVEESRRQPAGHDIGLDVERVVVGYELGHEGWLLAVTIFGGNGLQSSVTIPEPRHLPKFTVTVTR